MAKQDRHPLKNRRTPSFGNKKVNEIVPKMFDFYGSTLRLPYAEGM
ncbi:MAG: hypothetical protein WKF89_00295 [Chitinophagaceae bacterium]